MLYWTGADPSKPTSSLAYHREQFWLHCFSWPSLTTSQKLSEPLILVFLRTTVCCTNSSTVMRMWSQSNKIVNPWRNVNESSKLSSTLRNARSSPSSPTNDTRDTLVNFLKLLLTAKCILVSPSAMTSAGTSV